MAEKPMKKVANDQATKAADAVLTSQEDPTAADITKHVVTWMGRYNEIREEQRAGSRVAVKKAALEVRETQKKELTLSEIIDAITNNTYRATAGDKVIDALKTPPQVLYAAAKATAAVVDQLVEKATTAIKAVWNNKNFTDKRAAVKKVFTDLFKAVGNAMGKLVTTVRIEYNKALAAYNERSAEKHSQRAKNDSLQAFNANNTAKSLELKQERETEKKDARAATAKPGFLSRAAAAASSAVQSLRGAGAKKPETAGGKPQSPKTPGGPQKPGQGHGQG